MARAGDDVETFFKPPRMRSTSKVRARQRRDRSYLAWRAGELESRPWCEAKRPGLCNRRARVLHHRRTVKQRGALTSRPNTMAVCVHCHEWIHHNVSQARMLGWLVKRGDPDYPELRERGKPTPRLLWLLAAVVAVASVGVAGLFVVLVVFALAEGAI